MLDALLEYRTDGLILVSPRMPAADDRRRRARTPADRARPAMRQSTLDWVMTDEGLGAQLAVEHLVGAGARAHRAHRRRPRRGRAAAPDRLPQGDGGLRARAPRAWSCRASSPRRRASRASSSCWPRASSPPRSSPPTTSSPRARWTALEDEGLRVPEDVSIVGFDNTFLAALHHMSLTTVDQPRFEMGRLAFELLLERIDGRTARVGRLLEPGWSPARLAPPRCSPRRAPRRGRRGRASPAAPDHGRARRSGAHARDRAPRRPLPSRGSSGRTRPRPSRRRRRRPARRSRRPRRPPRARATGRRGRPGWSTSRAMMPPTRRPAAPAPRRRRRARAARSGRAARRRRRRTARAARPRRARAAARGRAPSRRSTVAGARPPSAPAPRCAPPREHVRHRQHLPGATTVPVARSATPAPVQTRTATTAGRSAAPRDHERGEHADGRDAQEGLDIRARQCEPLRWSATTRWVVVPRSGKQTRRGDAKQVAPRRSGRERPRVANAPLSYGAFEITVGTDFQVPDPEDVLGAIGEAGYAGTDLGPPGLPGRGRDAAAAGCADQPSSTSSAASCPCASASREHWDEDLAGLRHTLALFDGGGSHRRAARPVRRRRARADRQPRPRRRGPGPAPRRPPLGDAGRRRRARGRDRARGGLRARLPPPHVELRRGPAGDRALPRRHRRRPAARQRPPRRGRRRPDPGPAATGASASASSTSRTRAWTSSSRSASERADMISAWRRGLFCALGDGDVDLAGFCAELRRRVRRLGGDRAGPRARGQRRVRPRRRRAARQPRVAAGSTPDGDRRST